MGRVSRLPVSEDRGDVNRLIDGFLDDLACENKSPNTIRSYRADLRSFSSYYQGSVESVTAQVLREYFHLYGNRAPSTEARRRATLRGFFRWLVRNDQIATDPMEKLGSVKVPERHPRPLDQRDLKRILGAFECKRDRLLFTLIAETGLRINEALTIRVENIRLDAQEITVIGKGRRERTVYLVKTEAIRLLRQFLRDAGYRNGLLFRPDERKQRAGAIGRPLHYTTVNESWTKACARAGVHATIHQLRHTYASRLIREGKDIQVVSKILGHRRLATTQLYAEVSDEMVRRALEAD